MVLKFVIIPAHTLISVDVQGPFHYAGNAGFRPLVNYISGANVARQQIAMTTPVTHAPRSDALHTISFVLPEGMNPDDAPLPADSAVTVVDKPDATVAAFAGGEALMIARLPKLSRNCSALSSALESKYRVGFSLPAMTHR